MTPYSPVVNDFVVKIVVYSELCLETETLAAHPEVKMVGMGRVIVRP